MEKEYSLGAKLKEYRKKRGLSQAEFAKRIGKSTSTVYGYETDQLVPSFETITLISAILATDIATLLELEEDFEKDFADEKSIWEFFVKRLSNRAGK